MCPAIPGEILEVVDESNRLARVDIAGVRRTVNIGFFDELGVGDWVLIHVGFAISVIDGDEARATPSSSRSSRPGWVIRSWFTPALRW